MEERDPWTAFRRDPTEENFQPLYEGTKGLVWTLCLRILRNREDASEAFQSAYGRLVALARDRRPEPAWSGGAGDLLPRIAIREAQSLKKRRDRRRAREIPLEEPPAMKDRQEPPEEAVARKDVRERVEALVEALPESYRLPVQLHYFHGLSHRDVARALGQPASTVADRIRVALRKLDPAFRRAGLRDAAATLSGIAAASALFQPSLPAAEVFARAEAAPALSLTAADAASNPATSTLTLISGVAIMKAKLALVTGLVILLFAVVLFFWKAREREDALPAPASVAAPAAPVAKVTSPAARPAGVAGEAPPLSRGIEPAPPNVITGVVTDSVTGEPLPGAVVRSERFQAVTDAAGIYTLAGVPAGTRWVAASAEWHAERPAQVSHQPPARSIQDFPLDPAVSVLVSVVDESGAPIAGARVVK